MQTKVEVSAKIWDWIIRSVPLESMPEKVISSIEKWRSGDSQPTFNQLETLSKALGIPLGYFFLQTPPNEDLSIVEYRTIDSIAMEKPSRNLIEFTNEVSKNIYFNNILIQLLYNKPLIIFSKFKEKAYNYYKELKLKYY